MKEACGSQHGGEHGFMERELAQLAMCFSFAGTYRGIVPRITRITE